jgi:protein-S-isoprenylcysteine O-methyltransferase Ste14
MATQPNKSTLFKEISFYILGGLLIAAFVLLYFPRFFGIAALPPAIRFLFSQWGPNWAIAVNAGIFILFLFFLPYRTKIEWRSKGAFAAFILALMAEMFGIPFLLYILSPIMRISYYAKHAGGWLNNPLIFGLNGAVIGVWLTLIGMIIVIIGWHQIHNASGLVSTGLYKYIRHPQYTGFFLIMTGWLLHWETTLTLLMYPILAIMYYLLALKEDRDLKNEFGDEYKVYAQKTPCFCPFAGIFSKNRNAGIVREVHLAALILAEQTVHQNIQKRIRIHRTGGAGFSGSLSVTAC